MKQIARKLFVVLLLCLSAGGCRSAGTLPEFSAPIEIVDNRPFVAVRIKDRTFHFVIDTGGFNSIELEAAQALKLDLGNNFAMGGAGEKSVDAWTTVIDSFSIGDRSFENRKFYVLPLKDIKENLKLPFLDGIIGYDFFSEAVLQLDYPNKKVSFLKSYKGRQAASFTIYGSHLPKLKVEIDGLESEFVLDTGDRSQLTLGREFSKQILSQNQYALSAEQVTGYGLGGPIMAQTFSLKSLKFAHTEAKEVLTRIPNVKSGAFARADFRGSIGSGLLKNYKLTLDYPNKLIYLE